jgi:DNA-binding IscR family transcriptional regulator
MSVADVIVALEGPISITECLGEEPSGCDIERLCPTRSHWDRINRAVRDALGGLTIAEMATARLPFLPASSLGLPASSQGGAPRPRAIAPAPEAL